MKKITKKQIQSILRTEDRTQIFRLYVQLHGKDAHGEVNHHDVAEFIRENAPTKALKRKAYDIALNLHLERIENNQLDYRFIENHCIKHIAMKYLRYQLSMPFDSHTKLPIMGKTRLYFACPKCGHLDYNKHPVMKIEGNEKFCELICRLGEKIYERNLLNSL